MWKGSNTKHLLVSWISNLPISPLQTRCQPPCPGPSASCCLSCQGQRRPPPHPAKRQLLVERINLVEEKRTKTGFSPPCRGWRCPQVYRPFELQAHGATCANSPKAWNRGMQNRLYIEKSIINQGNKVKANSAHLLLILSTYSPVFWLAMLLGAMCSLKSGPKYSK